jgi:hypothetical protein
MADYEELDLGFVGDGGIDRPISQFTYMIDNDDQAAAWANNAPGNDYTSVLIIGGTFNVPGPINLGAVGTKRISGIPGATLVFHGSAQSCLYYDTIPTDISSYSISNITVRQNIIDSIDHHGLANCINLKCVTVDLANGDENACAFYRCATIDSCVAYATIASEGQAIGFYECLGMLRNKAGTSTPDFNYVNCFVSESGTGASPGDGAEGGWNLGITA